LSEVLKIEQRIIDEDGSVVKINEKATLKNAPFH
jgi:hypothetical protein